MSRPIRADQHGFAKPKKIGVTLKRLGKYFERYRFVFILVIVFILLSALAGVMGTYLLSPLVDKCIVPLIGEANPDLTNFLNMILFMTIVYIIGAASAYAYSRLMVPVSAGILCAVRKDMFHHMQKLPIGYFDTHTHGELMSLYTNDTDAMREMISQGVPQLINCALRVIGVFVMMVVLSPALTVLTVIMLAIMLLIITTLGKRGGEHFKRRQASLASVNGYMEEMIEGQKVVKVFCYENEVNDKFKEINEKLRKNDSSANTWANILMPIMGNLSYTHFAITAMVGALLVGLGGANGLAIGITIGTLTAFLQYTRNFSQPLTQLSQLFNAMLAALAGAERIFDLLDTKVEDDIGDVSLVCVNIDKDGTITESATHTGKWAWKCPVKDGVFNYIELRGDVRMNDVTFSYDGKVDVLKHITLYAKPGQKIALVGSTGAGKTTITNLINRFYDIKQGEITYDGIPLKSIKKTDLRRSLAMVLQDTHLFTGTVRENIRYGRLDATDAEVEAAAKLSNAHFFISHLPQGYDTMVTADGANLSQGQRQLLAIARVAVADPPVLILDEATSSIDTRTESLIEKGMDTLMSGRTVFVIAHRISTVRNSNAIMVLEHGEIIERGDHDSLIAQQGRYYRLYTGAFELD